MSAPNPISQVTQYIDDHRDEFVARLSDLLRIPSISADSNYRDEVRQAANWILQKFEDLEFSCELIETDGHPLVYAETPDVAGAPTILVYGHYDVQPPDPLDEWHSPPFEPRVEGDNVFARGATDDKGQMLTHLLSAEAWMETIGALPVKLKFLIEGEEEVGSKNLYAYLDQHADRLACDVIVVSDTSQFGKDQPAITYGLKGIVYYELTLQGPNQDLHSGTFGGAVSNPANALAKILAAIRDDEGRIQIPGFYDDVVALTEQERQQYADLDFDEVAFRNNLNVDELFGEAGYTTLERRWARPTFDINGLTSGYQGEGTKTVLPAVASAKFSFRLVPDQCPQKITAALESFLQEHCPAGIRHSLHLYHGAEGFLVPLDSPYVQAAARAIDGGFGKPPVFIRAGGSIPIVNAFSDKLGVDTLLLGWGLNDDNMHGPNEKFSLIDYHRGTLASAHLWWQLAHMNQAVS